MSAEEINAATEQGMLVAYHAKHQADIRAIVSQYGDRTFAELNANANRLVRLFAAHGIGDGDSVAVVTKNRPEFIETLCATTRSGIRRLAYTTDRADSGPPC